MSSPFWQLRDAGSATTDARRYTHYEQIILRKDNWNDVFWPIFTCRTLVPESFQRLYPIRVCTMHARIVTQDNEFNLHVETKRLPAAIRIAS